MPPLEAIQIIVGGGVAVVLGVGLWWLGTGRGRVGSLVDKREAQWKEEVDAWKSLAQSAGRENKRQNDLLEQAIKLLTNRP